MCAGQCPEDAEVVGALWMACHDPVPANTDDALLLWSSAGGVLHSGCLQPLLRFLGQPAIDVRAAAADALATSLQVRKSGLCSVMIQSSLWSCWAVARVRSFKAFPRFNQQRYQCNSVKGSWRRPQLKYLFINACWALLLLTAMTTCAMLAGAASLCWHRRAL